MSLQQPSTTSDCADPKLIQQHAFTIGGKGFVYCANCLSYHSKHPQKLDGKQYLKEAYILKTAVQPSIEQTPLERTIEKHTKKLSLQGQTNFVKPQLVYDENLKNPAHWKVYHSRQQEPKKAPTSGIKLQRTPHERNPSVGSEKKIHSLGKHLQRGSMKELRGIEMVQNERKRLPPNKNDILAGYMSLNQNPENLQRQRKLQVESVIARSSQKTLH